MSGGYNIMSKFKHADGDEVSNSSQQPYIILQRSSNVVNHFSIAASNDASNSQTCGGSYLENHTQHSIEKARRKKIKNKNEQLPSLKVSQLFQHQKSKTLGSNALEGKNFGSERRATYGGNSDQKDFTGNPGSGKLQIISIDQVEQQKQLRQRNKMRGRSMVERVERQESTGRDTIFMSNMLVGNANLTNHHLQHQITAA